MPSAFTAYYLIDNKLTYYCELLLGQAYQLPAADIGSTSQQFANCLGFLGITGTANQMVKLLYW